VRKGDFDHIVDDVSDGEGDEAAGAAARAEMELQEDRARDRAIITAVTEGHDAMRKMQKKGKYTFEKLVGGGENRRETAGECEHWVCGQELCWFGGRTLVCSEQQLLVNGTKAVVREEYIFPFVQLPVCCTLGHVLQQHIVRSGC
jgi:hypothetical protein